MLRNNIRTCSELETAATAVSKSTLKLVFPHHKQRGCHLKKKKKKRNSCSKRETFKFDWKLQMPTWTSQLFAGQERQIRLITMTRRIFEQVKLRPSNLETLSPAIKHGGGSIMLWFWWVAQTGWDDEVDQHPNSSTSCQINSLIIDT